MRRKGWGRCYFELGGKGEPGEEMKMGRMPGVRRKRRIEIG